MTNSSNANVKNIIILNVLEVSSSVSAAGKLNMTLLVRLYGNWAPFLSIFLKSQFMKVASACQAIPISSKKWSTLSW